MAKLISNLNPETLLFLIEDGYVINYKRYTIISVDEKPLKSTIKKQYLFKNKKYYIYYFDSYGIKNNRKTKELNKDDFLVYFNRDIKNKTKYKESDYFFDYHKQRVPRKANNNNLTDEFDIKKLVYEWLLKKDKEAVIVPEFGIGNKRADYISLGSKNTYVVEIKSELDTFDRLEEQLSKYQFIGNYIYMALHISKYSKLLGLNLNIPDNVGILVIENNKLKQIKRAIKNKFDKSIFKEYASFEECLNIFRGFKWASKFHKDQLVKIFKEKVSLKTQYDYFYEVLKNRHLKESNLRKEAFKNDDLEKALGSSKQLGISRLQINNIYTIKQYNSTLLQNDILYNYYNETVDKFSKKFKNYKNAECIIKDDMYPRILLKEFNIKLDFMNELSFYESSLEKEEEIKAIWNDLLKYCNESRERTIEKIKQSKDIIVLKVGSKIEYENMVELLKGNDVSFTEESTKDSYFHLQSYLEDNNDCKKLDCILLLATTKSYFSINREYGICLYENN